MIQLFSDIAINNPLPQADSNIVSNVLTVVFGVLGGISLIIIVWAGMKYTLSGGDPAKTAEAKNQIIYAAIGIAVASLATVIVRVTVGKL